VAAIGLPRGFASLSCSQSGKSNSLHQPVGLISPRTTWQLRGRMKNVQTAQLNMPFGVV
jgi:hypothetical protein